jgi:hypothetical protein
MSAAVANPVTVPPARSTRETLCVFVIAAVIAVAMTVFAQLNAQHEERHTLSDWQISAFDDLEPTDQAIYNALYAAAETLWVNYEFEKQWTAIADLDVPEYGLAPFVRDLSWKQTGEVQWQLIKSFSFDGATAYFGNNGKVGGQGAYLLILSHAHKGASYVNQSIVWRHPDPRAAPPDTIIRDSLIRNGWREIVPYSGDSELRRLGRKAA